MTKPCYLFTNTDDTKGSYTDLLLWQPDGTVKHLYGKDTQRASDSSYVGVYTSALSNLEQPRKALNDMFKIPTIKYIGRL
jgi:hypothetical protein